MPQKFFKTGEFAKLCHTTKDTLFHYDRIGLLRPAQLAANGYRLYTINQMYLFDLITIFKELGMSLEEIRHYIQKRNTQNFIAVLKEKNKQLEQELLLLKRRKSLLQNTLHLAESTRNIKENIITCQNCAETYYILSEQVDADTTEEESFAIWRRLIEYCEQHQYYEAFITGTMISEASIAANKFATFYFTSSIHNAVCSKLLHIRPAGRYARTYIRCSYDALTAEYAKFYAKLQSQKYTTVGAMYQRDISSYLTENKSDAYIMLLEMQVKG